ncbi:MAG: hypothetical protein ABT940_11170 [Alphaproteobacteria bacterium]
MSNNDFPAVLVMSRLDRETGEIHCFQDGLVLEHETALQQRVAMYQTFEMLGAVHYDLQIAHVDDAAACIQATRDELEAQRV